MNRSYIPRFPTPFPERALYVSMDNLWFANHSLTEVVEYHYTHGGTHLFIDEVHKSPSWQTLIKNIYDEYPDLHVAFTGSSMLKIDNSKADLSRRLSDYTLHGLSFREFLQFEAGIDASIVTLEELLTDHVRIAMQLTSQTRVLPLFEAYLEHGPTRERCARRSSSTSFLLLPTSPTHERATSL